MVGASPEFVSWTALPKAGKQKEKTEEENREHDWPSAHRRSYVLNRKKKTNDTIRKDPKGGKRRIGSTLTKGGFPPAKGNGDRGQAISSNYRKKKRERENLARDRTDVI